MSALSSSNDRDRVLGATDLVALVGEHVALKRKGREHVGLCPFHDDRSPSLAIVTHKGDAFYKCFACGAAGNAIDFVINFHKMPFAEALRFLAARAGVELSRASHRTDRSDGVGKDDLRRATALALKFYRRMLQDEAVGAAARSVVAVRGIGLEMADAFQLGYAPDRRDALQEAVRRHAQHAVGRAQPDASSAVPSLEAFVAAGLVRESSGGRSDFLQHRLVFPIFDELGRPIAFGGRRMREDDPRKYINSPESPLFHKSNSLYGIHLAKQAIIKSRVAIVTEGYTDVIACHSGGFTNVVATLGTALTVEHARMLRRLCDRVILLFDGDAAGMRAADHGVEVFFNEPIDVSVCTLPDDLDPDELLKEPDGAQRFAACIERSVDALAYVVDRFRREYAARAGLSGRQQALEALLRRLAELGFGKLSGVRKRFVLASLAQLTGISEREVEAALPRVVPSAARTVSQVVAATSKDSPSEGHADGHDATGTDVSRARREAERTLLAVLLTHPSVAKASVALDIEGESVSMPVTEAIDPERFRVEQCRSLYRTWRACVDGGGQLTASLLLAELVDADLKRLASDLLIEGERRATAYPQSNTSSAGSALGQLNEAIADLDRLDRRERFRRGCVSAEVPVGTRPATPAPAEHPTASDSSPTSAPIDNTTFPAPTAGADRASGLDLEAAQARLAHLRSRGRDVTAHPKFVRST